MNLKIRKLISSFDRYKIEALLVNKDVNITYLTGFPSSDSWLLVTLTKSYYITDGRYVLEAEKSLKGIEVNQYNKSLDQTLIELATLKKVTRLGFDPQHITYAQYKNLRHVCPHSIELIEVSNLVENLREIKSPEEVRLIRKALSIHKEAYRFLGRAIKPGVTEKAVLNKLENFIRRKNVGFSFSPIIASGPHSCLPHAKVTERKIRNNEIVLVDIGIDVNGYKSDLTRIFFLGRIPQFIRDIYDAVKEAQTKAIESIKSGVPVAQLDQLARNYLAKKDLAKYFVHSLGHGVGLEIHESPRLSQKSPAILKEGMVITIEPAVYLPHKFGIRIEDMVLVTKEKGEVLSGHID